MNDPLLAEPLESPLAQLLNDQFAEEQLRELLGPVAGSLGEATWDLALRRPLNDFLTRPAKEFRRNLVKLSYTAAGGLGACPEPLTQLVEILHAGSLIVDDIQDQSTWRRGRPALHCEYGVPVALNAANWLYFWAFALVEKLGLAPATELGFYRWMSRTLLACHHGQGLDLTARTSGLAQTEVAAVVESSTLLKTGALMELSAALGAIAAGAPSERILALSVFGRKLGIALQMLDDVGGLTSERRAHKGHEDLLEGRPTWPWGWLAQELPEADYNELRRMAAKVVARDLHPEFLAKSLRGHLSGSGRLRVRRYLHAAFAELQTVTGDLPELRSFKAEIQRLEKSYV